MDLKAVKKKYWAHRSNSKRKGVAPLDFDLYVQKIKDAGISELQIGLGNGFYQLARYGDTGDYTESSCRFIKKEENMREMVENGGFLSGLKKKKGRTKENHKGVLSMSQKKSKEFSIKSPSGEIIKGKNLKEFCDKNHLNYGNIWMVIAGKKPSALGWTRP